MTEIVLREVEVSRLNLQPGEVLVVRVKGEDFNDYEVVQSLREQFAKVFPNNRVALFFIGEEHEIKFETIKGDTTPKNYCDDCSCGKKERTENT